MCDEMPKGNGRAEMREKKRNRQKGVTVVSQWSEGGKQATQDHDPLLMVDGTGEGSKGGTVLTACNRATP